MTVPAPRAGVIYPTRRGAELRGPLATGARIALPRARCSVARRDPSDREYQRRAAARLSPQPTPRRTVQSAVRSSRSEARCTSPLCERSRSARPSASTLSRSSADGRSRRTLANRRRPSARAYQSWLAASEWIAPYGATKDAAEHLPRVAQTRSGCAVGQAFELGDRRDGSILELCQYEDTPQLLRHSVQ